MKAVRVHSFGSPAVLAFEDLQPPEPAADEVLVRVHAAGVGPWDAWVRAGKSVLDQPLPLVPGADLSGVAVMLGANVRDVTLGEEVFGVTNPRFTGAYAEYALAHVSRLARKPRSLSFNQAASVPVVAVTAYQMLFEHARVKPADRVLIHGAAGAVGAYAVQLAVLEGIQVIATARGADLDYVRQLGASEVIDTTHTRFEDVVERVDAVIDTVGGELQARSFSVLAPGGALISAVSEPDAARAQELGVRASFMLADVRRPTLARIADLFEAGKLKTHVGTILPLSAAREAHEILEGMRERAAGKIVLSVVEDGS